MGAAQSSTLANDDYTLDLQERLKQAFLEELCKRPSVGLTEVRRDGKDDAAIAGVITKEFNRCVGQMSESEFMYHMRTFSSATWVRVFMIIFILEFFDIKIFIIFSKLKARSRHNFSKF